MANIFHSIPYIPSAQAVHQNANTNQFQLKQRALKFRSSLWHFNFHFPWLAKPFVKMKSISHAFPQRLAKGQ